MIAGTASPPKVGMISLGCAKNLVDAEIMLGSVLQSGMQVTADAGEADVLVVNTCAFIDSAKEESIEAILEAHQQRGLGKKPGQKLIVSGCMSQRFSRELRESMPEVDAFVGLDQVREMGAIVAQVLNTKSDRGHSFVTERPTYIPNYDTPRFRLTPSHSAYLKIAEGCNHPCSFCVIPQMRGRHRSRTPASVLSEIRALVAEGVKEINLISQDTTYYGMDLWAEKAGPRQPVDSSRGPTLSALLCEIEKIEGDFWVRLLYTHPAHWSDELIETIAECRKVARYIDMPLQHIEEGMLGRMRRETSRAHIENLIGRLRAGIPGVALRTTFIVGFPGEDEEDYAQTRDLVEEIQFDNAFIFRYSTRRDTPAATMAGQIDEEVKAHRNQDLLRVVDASAHRANERLLGRDVEILCEGLSRTNTARLMGRTRTNKIVVFEGKPEHVGEIFEVKVEQANGFSLYGTPVVQTSSPTHA
jgi:ribosomal protein S12 methylthiotransferase